MSWKLSCTVLRGGISGNAGSLLDQQLEGHKQAFNIHRQDNDLFAFAGLWEHWQHDQQTLYSCAIMTTSATDFMQPIHERKPVIITPENYTHWLDKTVEEEEAFALLDNQAYSEMAATPVSDWVNNPQHDDEGCLR